MYIINFIICFSLLLTFFYKIYSNISEYKCHNYAMTQLLHNSLKKTLDKQNHYSRYFHKNNCHFIAFERKKKYFALGKNINQKLSIKFSGKVSND